MRPGRATSGPLPSARMPGAVRCALCQPVGTAVPVPSPRRLPSLLPAARCPPPAAAAASSSRRPHCRGGGARSGGSDGAGAAGGCGAAGAARSGCGVVLCVLGSSGYRDAFNGSRACFVSRPTPPPLHGAANSINPLFEEMVRIIMPSLRFFKDVALFGGVIRRCIASGAS